MSEEAKESGRENEGLQSGDGRNEYYSYCTKVGWAEGGRCPGGPERECVTPFNAFWLELSCRTSWSTVGYTARGEIGRRDRCSRGDPGTRSQVLRQLTELFERCRSSRSSGEAREKRSESGQTGLAVIGSWVRQYRT